MASVTENLSAAPNNDLRAISIYVASLSEGRRDTPPRAPRSNDSISAAANIYAGACGVCHDKPAGAASLGLPLSLSSSLREARPRNAINVIFHGISRRPGEAGPFMPAFHDTLTDGQIADVTAYIRARFTNDPAWSNIGDEIDKMRKGDPS
jgi:mono/diheme cytochrome c family protein